MTTVFVVASAKAKVGKEEQLERALKAMVGPTRAEPGCELYELYTAEKPGVFFFYERWAHRDALKEHTQTAHYKKLEENLPQLLEGEFSVHILTPASV
jgi:quinol monooxygenase YgiN